MPKRTNNTVDYMRLSEYPLKWCAGCGHGIVLKGFIRAVAQLGWDKNEVIAVSGIGCAARSPAHLDLCGIQTTHGRAICFSTGMKMARPDLKVVLFLGDGDCISIGGNHFLHAAARNIDLTVIVMNNHNFGMTGGQGSPTAQESTFSTTTPYGKIEPQLNICDIATAAGATFVARTTAYHVNQLALFIKRGLLNKGFSIIDCITPCPTGYGRINRIGKTVDMYRIYKESAVSVDKAGKMSDGELKGKIITGVFRDVTRPEYTDEYKKIISISRKEVKKEESIIVPAGTGIDHNGGARTEVSLCGSGGQGLVLAGVIAADASIRQGKNAVHSQSYGPEARGGASRSEVIVSDQKIHYPEVKAPDILLAMTQESFDKYAGLVKTGGFILVDSTFVQNVNQVNAQVYKFPISEFAREEIGNLLTANVVALGMLARLTGFISIDPLEKAVLARIPAGVRDLNIDALQRGYHECADRATVN